MAPAKQWRWLGQAGLLMLVIVAAYIPALKAGFIVDDTILITENPLIKAHDGLHRFWFTTQAPDYYPLTSSLWWLEWRLWGVNPAGYHVVTMLLHAANVVLIWILLRRLRIPGAWLAALIFGIHPVNVATVAWISETKNTVSMLLYLIAVLMYLRFDEDDSWRWYTAAFTAFLAALLSKSAVAMLPVVLLLNAWWLHGKLRWKDVLRTAPFFAAALAMALVTIWFQSHRAMQGHAVRQVGFAFRLAAAGWVPWFYLGKALVPVDLMPVYPNWPIDTAQWWVYLPAVILVGSLALFWRKRESWGRGLFFAWGYFVVTLFPVLGFFDQALYSTTLVADHWQYYSIIGIITLVVVSAMSVRHGPGDLPQRFGITASTVGLLILLGLATWHRAQLYANELNLWTDNLQKNPGAWEVHYNLGNALVDAQNPLEAIEEYRQALEIRHDCPDVLHNMAIALAQLGRVQEAIGCLEQLLRSYSGDASARHDLGVMLIQAGRFREAADQLGQTLRIDPNYPEAHYDLGIALEQLGRSQEAIEHYQQALRIRPDYREAQDKLKRLTTGR